MNCQVHQLPELETATSGTREALQAIIHTILFIRSPGPVAPHDVHCESFNMTYTRIATDNDIDVLRLSSPMNRYSHQSQSHHATYNQKSELDRKVDDAIEHFMRTLTPIGPGKFAFVCFVMCICDVRYEVSVFSYYCLYFVFCKPYILTYITIISLTSSLT